MPAMTVTARVMSAASKSGAITSAMSRQLRSTIASNMTIAMTAIAPASTKDQLISFPAS